MSLWIDDPNVLLSLDLNSWNPFQNPIENKINASTKILLITSALLALKSKNKKPFIRTVIAIGLVMIVYTLMVNSEKFWGGKPMGVKTIIDQEPPLEGKVDINNPLGNPLVGQTNYPPSSACAPTSQRKNEDIDNALGAHVPDGDLFYKNGGLERQFYQIPEDRDNFKEFLYGDTMGYNKQAVGDGGSGPGGAPPSHPSSGASELCPDGYCVHKSNSIYAHLGQPYHRLS